MDKYLCMITDILPPSGVQIKFPTTNNLSKIKLIIYKNLKRYLTLDFSSLTVAIRRLLAENVLKPLYYLPRLSLIIYYSPWQIYFYLLFTLILFLLGMGGGALSFLKYWSFDFSNKHMPLTLGSKRGFDT